MIRGGGPMAALMRPGSLRFAGAPRPGEHSGRARTAVAPVRIVLLSICFLILGLGAYAAGLVMWTDAALQEAASVGARCMGVLASSCASDGSYSSTSTVRYMQAVARDWNVALPGSAVTLNASTSCGGVAGFSQVTIVYTFQPAVPGLSQSLASMPLTAQACFPNQT